MAETGTTIVNTTPTPLAGLVTAVKEMPPQRRFTALIAAAAVGSLLVGALLWGRAPEYKLLYANLSDRDGGAVIQALQQMNVPYKFSEGGGSIQVPAAQVHDVRLRLASQGLPRGGNVGFELMENQKFGLTQFQEQVNYQRALEGELARSIQSLAAVQSARVHLAIPKPSVFLREQQKPSASVLVSLYPGRTLDRAQVAGIMHLVSSSVADLPLASVSVLDQNGALLSAEANGKSSAQQDAQQLAYVHQIEASYIKRIVDILEPMVGRNNVRAQVTADVDFSEIEATAETYKPNQNPAEAVVRSQQMHDSSSVNPQQQGGVPGALTNQPAPAGTAPINTPPGQNTNTQQQQQASTSSRKESTTNYEVDKTVRHTRLPTGSIKRLSAAVVVNHRRVVETPAPAADGAIAAPTVKQVALSPEELEKINALVREAMGFAQARGDSLSIANVPFSEVETAAAADVLPFWQQPDNQAYAIKLGAGALAALVLLVFMLMRRRSRRKKEEAEQVLLAAQAALPNAAGGAALVDKTNGRSEYDEKLKAIRELAKNDPKVVASVVKNWVTKDE